MYNILLYFYIFRNLPRIRCNHFIFIATGGLLTSLYFSYIITRHKSLYNIKSRILENYEYIVLLTASF